MSPTDPSERILAIYRTRIDELAGVRERLLARFVRISRFRTGTFLAALIPFLLIETSPPERRWLLVFVGSAFLAVFLVLVARHRAVRRELEEVEARIRFSEHGWARVERAWDGIPEPSSPPDPDDHPYAGDLDVTGRASLTHLLSTAATLPGRRTLRSWLLKGPAASEIGPRQAAASELAERFRFREDLWVRARVVRGESEVGLEHFLRWTEAGGDAPLVSQGRLWGARLLPPATFALLALHLAGAVPVPLWILTIGAIFLLERGVREPIHEAFDAAEGAEGSVRAYADLLERIGREEVEAPRLRRIRGGIRANEAPAHQALRGLRRTLDFAAARYSSLSHAPLRLLLAWDFHVADRLDRWRRRHGGRVRSWVEGLGEIEALSALGALAHDHPDWVFPRVDPDPVVPEERVFRAEQIGHPLLPQDRCVRNDVAVGPPGSFVLVTGSNMSGKSTLLRAIGLNAVLARVGGPVCARTLSTPVLDVHSSMRIRDSLEAGLSHFMAELRRLREVVEAARAADREGGPPVLYLLDEILQGTNTVERRVAARTVLRHLLETGAVGAVTTHDLTLATAPDLERTARPVHFRETIREEDGTSTLHFDYRLRPGLATTRNALQLMRLVGLEPPAEPPPGPPESAILPEGS